MNISTISNSFNNKINSQKTKNTNGDDFSFLIDSVAQEIRKNVKDPIDREEDLRFWNQIEESGIKYCKSGNKEMIYSDFDKEPKADEGMRQVVIFFVYKSLNSTYLIFT